MRKYQLRFAPRRYFLPILALIGVLASQVSAQEPPDKPFQPASAFDPATISLHTLPNGVRSVVKETRGTDLVSVQIWIKAGSRYENDKNNGVTYLIETLALRASQNYPASADAAPSGPAQALEALGGRTGSLTSRDSTSYHATVASPFFPNAMRALADATLRPNLQNSEVENVKAELSLSLQARAIDPAASAVDLAYRAAFDQHPYRKPAAGTASTIRSLTPESVRQYHAARYAGANISVVIVGDVRSEAAHRAVEREFGQAARAASQPATAPVNELPEFKTASRRGLVPIGAVTLGFRSPGIDRAADVIAIDVLLAHWKEGSDAAMRPVLLGPQANNEDDEDDEITPTQNDEGQNQGQNEGQSTQASQPLALAFDVDYLTQRDPGLFLITIVQPRSRVTAIKATLEEIGRVQTRGLSPEALERAKKALSSQYLAQSDTVSGQASSLGFYEMIDSYQFAVTYLDEIERITSEDVQRVAEKYLSITRYVQATIEPAVFTQPRIPPPLPSEDIITAQYIAD